MTTSTLPVAAPHTSVLLVLAVPFSPGQDLSRLTESIRLALQDLPSAAEQRTLRLCPGNECHHAASAPDQHHTSRSDDPTGPPQAPLVVTATPGRGDGLATVLTSGPHVLSMGPVVPGPETAPAPALDDDSSHRVTSSDVTVISLPALLAGQCGRPEGEEQDALYRHLLTATRNLDGAAVSQTLRRLGDRALIRLSAGLSGRQRFGQFEAVVQEMVVRPERRYVLGFDPDAMPDESRPTIGEVLSVLSDGVSVLLTAHPQFQYRRVAAGMTADPDAAARWRGSGETRITATVPHRKRANLSLQVVTPGTVTFQRVPPDLAGQLPETLECRRMQTYTVLHSGVLNVFTLPVRPSAPALAQLQAWHLAPADAAPGDVMTVDLQGLPLVRHSEIHQVSAERYARLTVQHEREKAVIRVLREAQARHFPPRTSDGLAGRYGPDAAAWLREQGVTDHGFSPRGRAAPGEDDLQVVELDTSIKGMATLPKTSDVTAKITTGTPLTPREQVIADALALVPTRPEDLQARLDAHTAVAEGYAAQLQRDRMAVLLGQTWFADLPADAQEITVTEGARTYTVTVSTREFTETV